MSKKRSVSYLVFSILLIAILVVGLIGCDDPSQAPEEVKKTISFESNGGSAVTSITGIIGSEVSEPANPTKEGYVFKGWYLDNETFQNKYSFTTIPLEDLKLYAKWEAKPIEGGGTEGGGTEGGGTEGGGTEGGDTETEKAHVFGEWKVVNVPTELMEGKAVRTCTNAGCNEKEEKVLPVLSMENYDHKLPDNAKCGTDIDIAVTLKADPSIKFTVKEFFNHMPTLQYDEIGHWHICPYCHEAISDRERHNFVKKTDDAGKVSYVCKECGYVQGSEEVAVKPYTDYKYIMDVIPTPYYNGVKHTNVENASNGGKMVFTILTPTEKATAPALVDTSLITEENYKAMAAALCHNVQKVKSGKYTLKEGYMGPMSTSTYVFSNGILNAVEEDPDGHREEYTMLNSFGGEYRLVGNTYSFKPNSRLLTVIAPDAGFEEEMTERNPIARILLNPALEFVTSSKFVLNDADNEIEYTVEITAEGFSIKAVDYIHNRLVTSLVFENLNGYNNTTVPQPGSILKQVPAVYDLFLNITHYGTNYEVSHLLEVTASTTEVLNEIPTQMEVYDDNGSKFVTVKWYLDKARTIEFDVNAYKHDLRDLEIYGKYGNVVPKKVVNVHIGDGRVEQVRGYSVEDIYNEVRRFMEGPEGGTFYKDSTFTTPMDWRNEREIPSDLYILVVQDREFELVVGGQRIYTIVKNKTGDPTIEMPLYGNNPKDGKYYTLPTTWYTDPEYKVVFDYNDYKLASGRHFTLYGKAFGAVVPEYQMHFVFDQKPQFDTTDIYCVANGMDPFDKSIIGRSRVEGFYANKEKTIRFDEEAYLKAPHDVTIYVNLKTEVTKYTITIMVDGQEAATFPYFDDEERFSFPRWINDRPVKQYFVDPEMTKPFDEKFFTREPSNLTLYAQYLDDFDKFFYVNVDVYDLSYNDFAERIEWSEDVDLRIPYYNDVTCEVYEYYLDYGKTTKFNEQEFKNVKRDIVIYRYRTGQKTPDAKKITINQNKGEYTIDLYHDTTVMGNLTMEKLTVGSGAQVTFYKDAEMTIAFDLNEWNANPVDITIYCKETFH